MSKSQARERNWNQHGEILVDAARQAGIDPQIMVKIAGFESSFDTAARPVSTSRPHLNTVRQWDGTMAVSSAYGLGQFLDDTWLGMVRKYGEKYGVDNAETFTRAQANAPGIRDNPRLQAAMLAEFTRENIAAGGRLGGPDPDANVYAMHNLGSGDARKFLLALSSNPDLRVDQVLSRRVISGNPSLYGDGGHTVSEAYRAMGAHMDAYQSFADRIQGAARQQHPARLRHAPPGPAESGTASRTGTAAIYDEAYRHFLANGNRFEYGRSDLQRPNHEGVANRMTDSSRTERDNDGDGLKGVDCSSFVWRGLRNAGYDVPAQPFSTHALFNGSDVTRYARRHFEVISAIDAAQDNGSLQPGDILLLQDKRTSGQHVGIVKGYDRDGDLQFIGSQISTGPAQVDAGRGTYWNGGRFEIVGALRARPEFQVRAPVHAREDGSDGRAIHEPPSAPGGPRARSATRPAAEADGVLRFGEKGPAVETLQRRLADLGYRGEDDKPLKISGDFDTDTRHALREFQRDHGLQGLGVAGPRTAIALDRAEGTLMSHPCNAHHALYVQVLEKVHAEERARGLASGHHSQRIAAALAVECLREGISRVDRVELSHDMNLARAVQVSALRDEPGLNRSTDGISTAQAARQTLLESTEQIRQVAVNVQAQQQDAQHRAMEHQPSRAQPALP